MKKTVAMIGSGSMGTALSVLLAKKGSTVRMWTPFAEEAEMINTRHEHEQRLPGVKIPEEIICHTDLGEAVKGAGIVVLAVPSQTMRQNAKSISKFLDKETITVCCSKGLEENSGKVMSDVIKEECGNCEVVILSGPSHAEEIAKGIPTTVVAACANKKNAELVQDLFMTPVFRVYTNSDVLGVELGGALKNIIAICAGISDGLGYGDNTKAALMTRGMAEIARLGKALGAKPQTFSGLTGIGDLIVTCTSMHSRNRRAGMLIGKGKSVREAIEEVKMVVEGVATTKPAYDLSVSMGITMPITTEAYNVLFLGKNPKEAVNDLMTREKKHETEMISEDLRW